jgi:hypothetical protein
VLELVSIETYVWYLIHRRNSSMVIMARRGAVAQVTTFGRRSSSVVGGPGFVRPVQITRVLDGLFLDREALGEITSGIAIDGAPGASG